MKAPLVRHSTRISLCWKISRHVRTAASKRCFARLSGVIEVDTNAELPPARPDLIPAVRVSGMLS
ncbi:hypothetical protein ACFWPH_33525 [Nocardia sp. NPDC058499]|uniref:hypothetical protein n=1 Tax=Nocardia sp. NPDC058499 TaxID=3346530 RepID=UPI0036566C18